MGERDAVGGEHLIVALERERELPAALREQGGRDVGLHAQPEQDRRTHHRIAGHQRQRQVVGGIVGAPES